MGALLGPLAGGMAVHLMRHGLPWFAAFLCFGFTLAALRIGPGRA